VQVQAPEPSKTSTHSCVQISATEAFNPLLKNLEQGFSKE